MKAKLKHDLFLFHPENRAFLDGESAAFLPKFPWIALCLMSLWAVIGLAIVGNIILPTVLEFYRYQMDGNTTLAEVISLSDNPNTTSIFDVTYQYTVNGQTYTGTTRYDQADEILPKISDSWMIVYLESDPAQSTPYAFDRLPTSFVIFSVIILVLLSFAVFFIVQTVTDQRQLRRNGRPIQGAFDGLTGGTSKTIGWRYRFQDPDTGQTVYGEYSVARHHMNNRQPPPIDTPIAIVWVNTRIHQML
ncbi:MAG: hypothetical protein MUF87_13420 [Anaerolineae bacterium]|jgi:hypothetical protein|nr:hypothetical protein [Anaerolineae bacterium]